MEIISTYESMYDNYKRLNYMESRPIYFDKTYKKKVYIIRLYDFAKRDYQKKIHERTTRWIYIYDQNIAKHLNLKSMEYRKLLKSFGAKYNRENGIYFETKDECDLAINKLYDYVFSNQIISLKNIYEE